MIWRRTKSAKGLADKAQTKEKEMKKMAIEKMKLLSITGPERELDRFIARNLLDTDIQIEDAKKIYNKTWKFDYYDYDYAIQENLKKCKALMQDLHILYREEYSNLFIENSVSQIGLKLDQVQNAYTELKQNIEACEKAKEEDFSKITSVEKLANLDVEINQLYHLKYIKFRYGNIANDDFESIKQELEDIQAIVFEIEKQEDVTWIVYVTTEEFVQNVDVYFNMQNFERVWLDPDLSGKPKQYMEQLYKDMSDKNSEILALQKDLETLTDNCRHIVLSSYRQLQTYQKMNQIKKYIMHDSKNTFYLVAWVPETQLEEIVNRLDMCQNMDYKIEEKANSKSPTKLKNSKLIQPFEAIVKMYGVPNTNEIDPTLFVAITAFLMFGFMFGDVGHGVVFLLCGWLLRKKSKDFGNILVAGGLASTIFGIFYGSVFGKEDIIPAKLIRPMNDINTMLIYGIVVGCVFILMAMILNIANGIKNHDFKRIWLDANGVAGLLLYGFILTLVAWYFLKGEMLVPTNAIVAIVGVLLILILWNDKLTKFVTKKKEETQVQMIEKIFELLEMMLSFASNTISFLRLAAFAINHVGLCMAIYLLADMTSGAGNLAIAILGNVIVLVLEGLIVGIQILRLEYYELFSRFYAGDGTEYQSIQTQTAIEK